MDSTVEDSSARHASSKFKWIKGNYSIRFAYEVTDNTNLQLKCGLPHFNAAANAAVSKIHMDFGKIGIAQLRRHRHSGGVPSAKLTELKSFMILIGE